MNDQLQDNIVRGCDKSLSAYNVTYKQSYHSKSLGAYSETIIKHIIPAALFFRHITSSRYTISNKQDFYKNFSQEILQTIHSYQNLTSQGMPYTDIYLTQQNFLHNLFNQSLLINQATSQHTIHSTILRPIRILDICFGLGYNAMLGLETFQCCEIYSPEKDYLLPELLKFDYTNIANAHKILNELQKNRVYNHKKQTLYFLHGNALHILESFPQGFFDIVFQDAFSQAQNPELWSKQYFQKLDYITAKNCIITTYAKAKNILESAQHANFSTIKYEHGSIFYK
ncbi:hypothetical protein CQA53_09005 [Helicobacter didelphidarum]|uniref:MnmC-like methyltransferase domain-containing protein n=1 Tax=Helicobacter didelphidarum TaxID=2040648 RepID=A0A3D8ID15_9HELI|nr:MnmC family methyltransferase [Helicobacter didelphidarum]RDU62836.1 hypothetical protein CQA53_09005 [Helicobacter didelphidarum]